MHRSTSITNLNKTQTNTNNSNDDSSNISPHFTSSRNNLEPTENKIITQESKISPTSPPSRVNSQQNDGNIDAPHLKKPKLLPVEDTRKTFGQRDLQLSQLDKLSTEKLEERIRILQKHQKEIFEIEKETSGLFSAIQSQENSNKDVNSELNLACELLVSRRKQKIQLQETNVLKAIGQIVNDPNSQIYRLNTSLSSENTKENPTVQFIEPHQISNDPRLVLYRMDIPIDMPPLPKNIENNSKVSKVEVNFEVNFKNTPSTTADFQADSTSVYPFDNSNQTPEQIIKAIQQEMTDQFKSLGSEPKVLNLDVIRDIYNYLAKQANILEELPIGLKTQWQKVKEFIYAQIEPYLIFSKYIEDLRAITLDKTIPAFNRLQQQIKYCEDRSPQQHHELPFQTQEILSNCFTALNQHLEFMLTTAKSIEKALDNIEENGKIWELSLAEIAQHKIYHCGSLLTQTSDLSTQAYLKDRIQELNASLTIPIPQAEKSPQEITEQINDRLIELQSVQSRFENPLELEGSELECLDAMASLLEEILSLAGQLPDEGKSTIHELAASHPYLSLRDIKTGLNKLELHSTLSTEELIKEQCEYCMQRLLDDPSISTDRNAEAYLTLFIQQCRTDLSRIDELKEQLVAIEKNGKDRGLSESEIWKSKLAFYQQKEMETNKTYDNKQIRAYLDEQIKKLIVLLTVKKPIPQAETQQNREEQPSVKSRSKEPSIQEKRKKDASQTIQQPAENKPSLPSITDDERIRLFREKTERDLKRLPSIEEQINFLNANLARSKNTSRDPNDPYAKILKEILQPLLQAQELKQKQASAVSSETISKTTSPKVISLQEIKDPELQKTIIIGELNAIVMAHYASHSELPNQKQLYKNHLPSTVIGPCIEQCWNLLNTILPSEPAWQETTRWLLEELYTMALNISVRDSLDDWKSLPNQEELWKNSLSPEATEVCLFFCEGQLRFLRTNTRHYQTIDWLNNQITILNSRSLSAASSGHASE